MRLVSGPTNFSGRVEIQDASKSTNPWGTICDDRWDNKAASVVCRQLGYKWGVSFFTQLKDCLPYPFYGFRNKYFNNFSIDNRLYFHKCMYKF